MGGDGTLHLEEDKPQGDQPHLRPLNDPGWSEGGSPWDRDSSSVVGVCPWALVPVSSCAEEVTKHSPVVESNLGEALRTWGGEGERVRGMLGCPFCHQQLFLGADSKGSAANWRHIRAPRGNGGCWQSQVATESLWHQLDVGSLLFHPGCSGKTRGAASTSTGEQARPCLWQAAAGRC